MIINFQPEQSSFMKYIFLLPLIFFSLAAYNQDVRTKSKNHENAYRFDGVIRGMDSGWIYIGHPDTTGKDFSYLDSSKIVKGSFKFEGKIDSPEPCVFVFKPGPRSIQITSFFILDKGRTTGLLFKDSMAVSIITGTPSQDQFLHFTSSFRPTYAKQIQLQILLGKNPDDSNSLKLFKINEANQIDCINQSIKANPGSLVSAYIAAKYFPLNANAEELENTCDLLQNKTNYYSRQILATIATRKSTAIGQPAPDFNVIDKENTEVNNKSFKGEYFLIDFWASWCVPCRKENPFLLKSYDLFHSKGFNILSISLDDRENFWQKAVKEDKLPWRQVCDFKVLKSPAVISFGVKVIPTNFLIDKNGKIIAKDLKGDQLINTLSKLL